MSSMKEALQIILGDGDPADLLPVCASEYHLIFVPLTSGSPEIDSYPTISKLREELKKKLNEHKGWYFVFQGRKCAVQRNQSGAVFLDLGTEGRVEIVGIEEKTDSSGYFGPEDST